jgi:uncharacterized membrane protein YfcA
VLSIANWIFLFLAAGFAGFVDAIAGGGGLVQLPALLIALNHKPIPLVLGTNKVPSIFGTSTAAINYFRKVGPNLILTAFMATPAFIGSAAGAHIASKIPTKVFQPVIFAALILVALYTWKKPDFGMEEKLRFSARKSHWIASLMGLFVGFYDGVFGPGTGTFLIFLLVGVLGYQFLKASATAKIVNVGTNLAAILTFQFTGHIWWALGLPLAIANVTGGLIGSHLAIKGGSGWVRKVFLFVVCALILKVGYSFFIA